ncbi:unnamed protein product [Linum tenue]|uniref:CCT domain-containing protein n=1 Tax=Linum tenue TaxID=586396 RepID=A0AAV0HDT3_9ROSI|nr:unnamed protein product [Linum tenue]
MNFCYENLVPSRVFDLLMGELLLQDDVSSPISAQLLEFCDSDFFQETMQNSDVTSSSNCCYDENSPYTTNLSLPPDLEKYNHNNTTGQDTNNCNTTNSTNNNNNNNGPTTSNTTTSTTSAATAANTTATTTNSSNLSSILFDSQDELDNDISASIDFTSSPVAFSVPPFSHNNFDFTSIHPHHLTLSDCLTDHHALSHYSSSSPVAAATTDHHHHQHNHNNQNIPQFMIPSLFEEDCLSSVPSYVHLNPASPSCSFLGTNFTTFMPSGAMSAVDNSGIFTAGGIYMGGEQLLQSQELDYQGDNGGIYCPSDSLQRVFNPSDLQAFSNETKQLVGGAPSSTPLTTELASLEDSSFKVGKLSVEQRKEKIHRYMKKRNERNFSKKIKYACRKTLADSRPRVRGRFAKNDDFGDTNRAACSNHEEEEDDEVAVKEEVEMVDQAADIFSHISGVNSFNRNYIQSSWI